VWSESGFLSAFNEDPLWGSGMIDYAGSGVVYVPRRLSSFDSLFPHQQTMSVLLLAGTSRED